MQYHLPNHSSDWLEIADLQSPAKLSMEQPRLKGDNTRTLLDRPSLLARSCIQVGQPFLILAQLWRLDQVL